MKSIKSNKGITLVALIITIVVLLILAAVAIGTVKDSDIIGHAQNAATEYDEKKVEEEGTLKEYEEMLAENSGAKVSSYTEEGIPVPLGFKVVEGTKDTGLVIEHKTEGSQFVWVPATGFNPDGYTGHLEPDVVTQYDADPSMLAKAGLTVDLNGDGTINENDFKEQLTSEYKAMVASVNHYGGFYVGRYEVSINGGKAQSKGSTEETPVYSATAATNSADTWYGLYKLCKTYNTNSVKSSMIWGSQYDAMMTWMGTDESSFDTSKRNTDSERKTGSVETDKIRNVYDLGGNSYEWTLEAYRTNSRVNRGASYNNFAYIGSPSSRGFNDPPNTDSNVGSRLALYVAL